jgi:CheY-like chemotaxis protein
MKATIRPASHNEAAPRILVITDEPELAKILSHVFKGGGFDVHIAATGTNGLQLAEELKYDLILSDIDLPDISGCEICVRLKQNPRLRSVPIILMSGWLAEGNQERALNLGAVDYLSKPFGATTALKMVSSHIRGTTNAA